MLGRQLERQPETPDDLPDEQHATPNLGQHYQNIHPGTQQDTGPPFLHLPTASTALNKCLKI